MRFAKENVPKYLLKREEELREQLEKLETKIPYSKQESQRLARQVQKIENQLNSVSCQITNRLNGGILA